MKKNTSSIFFKILVFNMLFITAATLIFQLIFYSVLDREYIKQYEQLNISSIQRIFNSIEENIISRATKIPENYFSPIPRNQGVTYPMNNPLENNPLAISKLKDRLDDIALNYEFITSFDIYYPSIHTVVTNFGKVHYIGEEGELERYIPWLSLYQSSNQKSKLISKNNLNYPQNDKVITYATSMLASGRVKAILGIHINTELLGSYIGEQMGHFIMMDRGGDVIYEKGSYDLKEVLPQVSHVMAELETGEGKLSLQGIDGNMVLTYQFSEVVDAIYIQISPKNIFYQDYDTFDNIIKFMCAIAIVVNLLGVLLISKRANKTYGKETAIAMESLDDKEITFDRAIKQISNKIYDLKEKVESTKHIVLGNEVRNIIEGNISSQTEAIIVEQIDYKKIYSCIIKNKRPEGLIDLIQVDNLLEQEGQDFKSILVQNKENEISLLIAYNEENYPLTLQWIREFGEKVCGSSNVFLIGNSYDTCISGIIASFKEVNIVREYHYILPDKKWLYYDDLDDRNAKATKSHLKIFAQIENAIKSSDYPQVKMKIEQLIAAFQSGYYRSHYCKATLRDLVTHIYHLSESYQINSMEAYGYDIRQHFVEIEDINEFKEWILPICKVLMDNIGSNKEEIGKELEEKILHIIGQNLENDISLEFIADQINMRADTLSKLFKVLMGKNYSEYIKEEKLRYALKLLMTKKYSVKEIADKLGYSSTQYFIKIFKEEFGETPKQYQKQNSGKEEEGSKGETM